MNSLPKIIFFILLMASCPLARATAHHSSRGIKSRHSIDFMSTHNTLQIEGYLNFQSNNGQLTTGYPNALIRFGFIKVLELRLAVEALTIVDRVNYTTRTGINPLQLGFKVRFLNPKGYRPAMAFTGSITMPTFATSNFRQTYWAPQLQISAEQDITSRLSFEYALGIQWDADNFQRSYYSSINMEYDFTSSNTVYADFYYMQPIIDATDMRLDVGINRGINQYLRFDFSTGAGLTTAAPEFFFNFGLILAYHDWKKAHHFRPTSTVIRTFQQ